MTVVIRIPAFALVEGCRMGLIHRAHVRFKLPATDKVGAEIGLQNTAVGIFLDKTAIFDVVELTSLQ